MAIVIPVAIEGLRVANQAGLVGERKAAAARVAARVLNELVATGQWQRASQMGVQREGWQEYRWQMRLDSWQSSPLRQLTVEVFFDVQGREYPVRLSTLVDPTQQ